MTEMTEQFEAVDDFVAKEGDFTKFKLVVDGKSLYVDAHCLAQISPYFASLCFEDVKAKTEQMATIDGNFDDMRMLIDYITSTQSSAPARVSAANFAVLIGLADKLKIESLLTQCKAFVLSSDFDFTHIDEAVLLQMLKAVALVGSGTMLVLAKLILRSNDPSKLIARAAAFDYKTLKEQCLRELPGPIAACLVVANAARLTTDMHSDQMDTLYSYRIPTMEIDPDFLDSYI